MYLILPGDVKNLPVATHLKGYLLLYVISIMEILIAGLLSVRSFIGWIYHVTMNC